MEAAEEYAVECAILKVAGSEVLDYAVDEGVQIYGGNGFIDEYDISRAYRDSRVNRIFEGTNEINRLLTLDMMIKRALKGRLDLLPAAMDIQKELTSIPDLNEENKDAFSGEKKQATNLKKAILMISGSAVQKLSEKMQNEQEIVMNLADMLIETYLVESALLRIMKNAGKEDSSIREDILHTYLTDATDRLHKYGKDAINAFAEGDEHRILMLGLKRFTKPQFAGGAFNTKEARRRIAKKLIAEGKYCF
jgi:hypothetical protein